MWNSKIDGIEMLPKEIMESILSAPCLSIRDVLDFGASCKYLYNLVRQNNHIWKNKFIQSYPQFLQLFNHCFMDWHSEIEYIHGLRRRTHALLSTMSPRFYKLNELSDCDFAEWYILISESPRAYCYIVWDLLNILNDHSPINSITVVPIDTPGNRTFQYYAAKVLRSIRQKHLSAWWEEYSKLPESEQLLEKGAFFVAQWCQPHGTVEYEDIAMQLDNLAKEVIKELPTSFPNHPLLQVPQETLLKWKLYNLIENQWNVVECKQLMYCLKSVLYINHKFCGNTTNYYMPENSYIDQVLSRKQGLPITLSVIFESVARRIGLKCEAYGFPSHFLLKFTEGRGEANSNSYYIDVFKNGDALPTGMCPRYPINNPEYKTASAHEVVLRLVTDMQQDYERYSFIPGVYSSTTSRSILELKYAINAKDLNVVHNLANFYRMYDIDLRSLESFILLHDSNEIVQEHRNLLRFIREVKPSPPEEINKHDLHFEDVKFAVGMVMRHSKYCYVCVIYNWDPICKADKEWQKRMRVNELKYDYKQPFYNVLVEDGTERYAAQENLELVLSATELDCHNLIGKYFSHFYETHYVPNYEEESVFPADGEIRRSFHNELKNWPQLNI